MISLCFKDGFPRHCEAMQMRIYLILSFPLKKNLILCNVSHINANVCRFHLLPSQPILAGLHFNPFNTKIDAFAE